MRSKLIILFAIIVLAGLTILLSIVIEKNKTEKNNTTRDKKSKADYELQKEMDKEDGNGKNASGAMESMQWISEVRAYPGTDIPEDKFYKAFEYSKRELQTFNERAGDDHWESIGPNNIGGRSLCIAVHPVDTSIVYMGSSSGGLWKSVTGGGGASAWTLVNTGFPSSAVSSIAIDSLNPNVMYIGTGENYGYQLSENGLDIRVTRGMYGIGILKTTDGGITWSKSLDWSYQNKSGVWSVQINPKNSNVVYAGTSEGIYKSINAGASWSQVLNYQMVMDLKINPVDTNILYASIGNLTNNVPLTNKGIFKSTDGGNTWTKLAGGLPAQWSGKATLEVYRKNPSYVFASIPNDFSYVGYFQSSNAGLNWTQLSTTVPIGNQGWYNNGHLVKPDDSSKILVGTINVEKSTNSGTSFTTKSSWSAWNTGATPPGEPEGPQNFVHADVHFYSTNPKDPNKIYIAADGGLYRSNNFGESFFSCNGGFVTAQFYASFVNSYQDPAFALGGLQDNRTALYQGSNAWYKTFFGDGMSCGINSQNDNICYTEYSYGAMYRSNNKGFDWNSIAPPGAGTESNYCFVTPFVSCYSNPSILYVGGKSVYKSVNNGDTWTGPYGASVFGGTKILSMIASNISPDTVFCGSLNGKIFRSINAGLNWSDVSGGITPDRYVTDMSLNLNRSSEVFATFGGFGSGHVYRSSDAGNTWSDISGNLPDVPHHCVVSDPVYTQNIYAGNDLGVYVTTNGGVSWHEFMAGMPYALVFDLSIVHLTRQIRASTYGNGVYERFLYENPVSVSSSNTVPENFNLGQNFPNPFNPHTKITFSIPSGNDVSNVKLIVYDAMGREIDKLVDKQLSPGSYESIFNGVRTASGIYFYKLAVTSGSKVLFTQTKKMILVK